MEDQGVKTGIILKCIFKNKFWNRFSWLNIVTSGGVLWIINEPLISMKGERFFFFGYLRDCETLMKDLLNSSNSIYFEFLNKRPKEEMNRLICKLGPNRYFFFHCRPHFLYMFLNNNKIKRYYILYGTGGKEMWVVTDRAYLPAGIQFIFHSLVSGLWYDAPSGLCTCITSRFFKGNGISFWSSVKIRFRFICGLMYMYTAKSL